MKMLILCNKFPYPPKDGGAIAMYNMIKGLYHAGVDLTVIGMNTDKHPVNLGRIQEEIEEYATFYAVDAKIKFSYIDILANFIFSQKSYIVSRFYKRGFASQIEKILKEGEFDIVQLETLYMTPYIKKIKQVSPNSMIIYRAHNVEHEIWERMSKNTANVIKRYGILRESERLKTYETKVVKNHKNKYELDLILAISGRDAGSLKKLRTKKEEKNRDPFIPVAAKKDTNPYKDESKSSLYWKLFESIFVLIYKVTLGFLFKTLPIDKADRKKPKPKEAPIEVSTVGIDWSYIKDWQALPENQELEMEYPSLFFLGALDWPPNQEGLLWFLDEVWPILINRYPGISLSVAGRRMPQSIKKKQIEGVEFIGEIDDALAFMKQKAIMVAPLLSGSGVRVKIIEGLGMGKAIVATPIAAEGLDSKHGQHLFLAEKPKDFADCVSMLIEKRPLFDTIRTHGLQLAEKKYDNQVISEALVKKYEAALQKKGG